MDGQNIYSAKRILRLFIAVHFVFVYSLFWNTAYSESRTDELISASKNGDAAQIKEFMVIGLNVNEKDEYGSTALIYAANNKNSNRHR